MDLSGTIKTKDLATIARLGTDNKTIDNALSELLDRDVYSFPHSEVFNAIGKATRSNVKAENFMNEFVFNLDIGEKVQARRDIEAFLRGSENSENLIEDISNQITYLNRSKESIAIIKPLWEQVKSDLMGHIKCLNNMLTKNPEAQDAIKSLYSSLNAIKGKTQNTALLEKKMQLCNDALNKKGAFKDSHFINKPVQIKPNQNQVKLKIKLNKLKDIIPKLASEEIEKFKNNPSNGNLITKIMAMDEILKTATDLMQNPSDSDISQEMQEIITRDKPSSLEKKLIKEAAEHVLDRSVNIGKDQTQQLR